MKNCSRLNPSPRYRELILLYAKLHRDGDQANELPPEETFNGYSLRPHIGTIAQIAANYDVHTVLDYGCGKAQGYENWAGTRDGKPANGLKEIWAVDEIGLYDPGYAPYRTPPTKKFDLVISTDVLEHCPKEDISWIVDEIFSYSTNCVFCTVAIYPAKKKLPTGENAHITIESPEWWKGVFDHTASRHGNRQYFLAVLHGGRDGTTWFEN
ncbi:MAG: class I SAM-dependent methyltransferase [Proteobacteria bacterium]|nr:class I SAM-dependent methyltransferase [Pseudomonadota bacterium]